MHNELTTETVRNLLTTAEVVVARQAVRRNQRTLYTKRLICKGPATYRAEYRVPGEATWIMEYEGSHLGEAVDAYNHMG